jgi:predicted nuclease of predicted toxin-antitoxin system
VKVLLDQNLSQRIKPQLEAIGFDVKHVREIGLQESPDEAVWEFARKNGWTIVSKDGDFAGMALIYGPPPKVIRLRIGNSPWQASGDLLVSRAIEIQAFLDDPSTSLLLIGDLRPRG